MYKVMQARKTAKDYLQIVGTFRGSKWTENKGINGKKVLDRMKEEGLIRNYK